MSYSFRNSAFLGLEPGLPSFTSSAHLGLFSATSGAPIISSPGLRLRDAVRDCINVDLNDLLAEYGLNSKYDIGNFAVQGRYSTIATSVWKPLYDTVEQNDLRLWVSQEGREFLLDESVAGGRGSQPRTFSNNVSNFSIYVELYKRLAGQDDISAYPVATTDELQTIFELIEDLLFCKRQYDIEGSVFYQDVAPIESGPEQNYFVESGVFAKQLQLIFRNSRCCQ